MMRFAVVATVGAFFLGGLAHGDVPPPNSKRVRSMGKFDNLKDFPDYLFFAATHPDNPFREKKEKDGQPFLVHSTRLTPEKAEIALFTHYTQGQMFLLAVPKGLFADENPKPMSDWFDGKTPGILQVEVPGGDGYAPKEEERDEFWTNFRLRIEHPKSGGGPKLILDTFKQERPDPRGPTHWYIAGGVALMAAATIVGLLVLIRRKRAASEST